MYVGASSIVSIFPRVSPVCRFPDRQWSPGGIAKYESAGGDILGFFSLGDEIRVSRRERNKMI
jgi:hypothetical protein